MAYLHRVGSRFRGNLAANILLKRPSLFLGSSTRASVNRFSSAGSRGGDVSLSEDDLIPEYVARVGESEQVKRARLLYQSRKRGMLENGLLLSTFADRYLNKLSVQQLDLYDELINRPSNDWQLYYWITGREETPARYDNEVMKLLQEHSRNENKEERLRQPDLKPNHS